MTALIKNNAIGVLSADITSSDTSLTLNSGQGALFPSPTGSQYFFATLISATTTEIVKCTARSGDTFTIVRAQDNSTAAAFSAGDRLEIRPIAALFDEKLDQSANYAMKSTRNMASGLSTFSVSKTLLGNYHVNNGSGTGATDQYQAGITFQGQTADEAQAGLYVLNNVSGGTSMALATTDNQTTGPQIALTISAAGALNAPRSSFTAAGNVTAYSDERFKENWRPLDKDFLERFAGIKYGVYDRIDIVATQVGVSAQALQRVLPEAVMTDEEGRLSVAYGNAALVAVIKLAQRVLDLEAQIDAIKRGT